MDVKLTVEVTGNHGCGKNAKPGERIIRCGLPGCATCAAVSAFNSLLARVGRGNMKSGRLEYEGVSDDLVLGQRIGAPAPVEAKLEEPVSAERPARRKP